MKDIAEMRRENRLRTLTDKLVKSPLFATNFIDRMERIQAAYDLAADLDDAVAWTREP